MPVNLKSQGLLVVLALLAITGYRALPARENALKPAPTTTAESRPSPNLTGSTRSEAPVPLPPNPCSVRIADVLDGYAAANAADAAPDWQVLLALVPDPLDSGMAYYFDAVVEGLEAATADGFTRRVRDRFWLPWRDLDGIDPAAPRKCTKTHPGVLVYRPSEAQGRPLAVFLVGETPTWGFREPVLRQALELADGLLGGRPGHTATDAPERLGIVGPTFSGTAQPLRATLGSWLARGPSAGALESVEAGPISVRSFDVRSGTATNPSVKGILEKGLDGAVHYASSIADDQDLRCAFFRELQQSLRVPCKRPRPNVACRLSGVALLSEGSTFYGSEFKQAAADTVDAARIHCPEPELEYSFPNVVAVRSAYELGNSGSQDATPVQIRLDPSLARDPPPRLHPSLSTWTPVAHDIALGDVLADLSEKDTRYVGIVATDVNDTTFLAERVKRQLPDVRLFTFGSDVVYVHPKHAGVLNGMLLAQSRPDLERVRTRGDRVNVRQREMVDGVYEAARSLLDGERAREPARSSPRVSVVSNGKFWILDPLKSAAGRVGVPRVWKVLLIYLGFFGFFNGAAYIVLSSRPRALSWSLFPLYAFRRCERPDLRSEHDVRALALLVVVVMPLLLVASVQARFASLWAPLTWSLLAGSLVAGAALIVALVRALKSVYGGGPALRPSIAWGHLLLVLGIGVLLGIGAFRWGATSPLIRTMSLVSGVSPLAPVLFGAALAYVAILCGLIRLRLLDDLRHATEGVPVRKLSGPVAQAVASSDDSSLGRLEKGLLLSLHSPWLAAGWPVLFLYLLLFSGFALLFFLKPVMTLELFAWHWFLIAVFVAAVVMIAAVYVHLWVFWAKLRALLGALALHPVADALGSIPKQLRLGAGQQILSPDSGPLELTETVALLGQLAATRTHARRLEDLAELPSLEFLEAERLRAEQHLEADTGVRHDGTPASGGAEVIDVLLGVAHELSRALRPLWLNKKQSLLGDADQDPGTPSGGPSRALELYAHGLPNSSRAWLGRAERYLGAIVAVFIVRYVRQFRYFVIALITASVLLVLLTSLYAFQPQRLMLTLELIGTTVVVVTALGMFVALDRDPVISSIAGSKPGVVTFNSNFATRLLTWGVLPMASVLAAQYPEFTQWMLAAIEPFARALR